MVTNEGFRRFLTDAEIHMDRIADKKINDLIVMLDMAREQVMEQHSAESGDLYMRTLELVWVYPECYFASFISDDLTALLNDIREAHRKENITADEDAPTAEAGRQLQES